MRTLGDLLGRVPLPELELGAQPVRLSSDGTPAGGTPAGGTDLVHDLGAGLPAGHLHLWGGAEGVGKTAFFLSLLHGAAKAGRGVVYATYDLPIETLALRLLAMTAGVEVEALPDPDGHADQSRLDPAALLRAHQARRDLAALPFALLPARGLGVASLEDRLVRAPFRPTVLAVDYLQGVIRPAGSDLGSALRDLAALATRCYVATLCAVRSRDGGAATGSAAVDALAGNIPDRVGWIAARPATARGATARGEAAPAEAMHAETGRAGSEPSEGARAEVGRTAAAGQQREAKLLSNRHGPCASVGLRVDAATGALSRSPCAASVPISGVRADEPTPSTTAEASSAESRSEGPKATA